MSLNFHKITLNDVNALMPIEEACHSHPWNENTFISCIGGRYFGDYAKSTAPLINNETAQEELIVGFFIGEYVAGEATLMDICIDPSRQGQGFGKQLLGQFIEQSKQLAATKIWLEVRAKNISAQMLYINHGFIETGRRTGYYPSKVGFGYEDAIIMCKTV